MTTKKIALITGANKGIGFETARQLGERGITVLVGARDESAGSQAQTALRDQGADARFVQLDVTDEKSVTTAAELIDAEYGSLDILVNNAAIANFGGPFEPSQTDLGVMRAIYETNVFGVVVVTNAMLPLIRRSPAGRIVNVSSEAASITFITSPDSPIGKVLPPSLPYPSSKSALNMITVMYAKELKDTPIKVNAVNPGYTRTDMNNNTGYRTPAEGAEPSVHFATLPDDGPTGQFGGYLSGPQAGGYGLLPW